MSGTVFLRTFIKSIGLPGFFFNGEVIFINSLVIVVCPFSTLHVVFTCKITVTVTVSKKETIKASIQ